MMKLGINDIKHTDLKVSFFSCIDIAILLDIDKAIQFQSTGKICSIFDDGPPARFEEFNDNREEVVCVCDLVWRQPVGQDHVEIGGSS